MFLPVVANVSGFMRTSAKGGTLAIFHSDMQPLVSSPDALFCVFGKYKSSKKAGAGPRSASKPIYGRGDPLKFEELIETGYLQHGYRRTEGRKIYV